MRKRSDVPKRGEVKEKNDECRMDMIKSEVNLDKLATDVETVRTTLDSLDLSGTEEGTKQVEKHIEGAEDVTKEIFTGEDEQLERVHNESQHFEDDLHDREGSSESDMKKILDANQEILTTETISGMERAKESALMDLDFFKEQISRAKDARDRSDQLQKELKSRVFSSSRRS